MSIEFRQASYGHFELPPSGRKPNMCPVCYTWRTDGKPPTTHRTGCSRGPNGMQAGPIALRTPRVEPSWARPPASESPTSAATVTGRARDNANWTRPDKGQQDRRQRGDLDKRRERPLRIPEAPEEPRRQRRQQRRS